MEVVLHHHRPPLVDLVLGTDHGLDESHDVAVSIRGLPDHEGEIRRAEGIAPVERGPPLGQGPSPDDQEAPDRPVLLDVLPGSPRADQGVRKRPHPRIVLRHLTLYGTLGRRNRQEFPSPRRPVVKLHDANLPFLLIEQRAPHCPVEIAAHADPLPDVGFLLEGVIHQAGEFPCDLLIPVWKEFAQAVWRGHDRNGDPLSIGHVGLATVQVPSKLRPIARLDVNQGRAVLRGGQEVEGDPRVPADDPLLECSALFGWQGVLIPLVLQ